MADISPTPSVIDRILGRMPSDPAFEARMNLAKQKMTQEMPNEMAAADIQPTGFFGGMKDALVKKAIGGTPVATTGPFGGVTYNPEQLRGMDQNELEDTLAHELTHVRQYSGGQPNISVGHGIMNVLHNILPGREEGLPEETKKNYRMHGYDPAYRGKASEMEAYGTEEQRKLNTQRGFPGDDIQLFAPRKTGNVKTGPSQVEQNYVNKMNEEVMGRFNKPKGK